LRQARAVLHSSVAGSGQRVVLVHGFTQSGRSWQPVSSALARSYEVVTVDAPGHGRSAAVAAGLWDGADLLAAAGGEATWVGYSMGGRYTLHVALRHPGLVRSLVLVSATPGIADSALRAARHEEDLKVASRVEEMGLEGFVAWWLSQPLFATLPPSAAAPEARLGGTAAGLAESLRLAGTGSQEPLWPRLASLRMPVLVVAGSLDAKYCEIAAQMAAAIGDNATMRVIAGAGHACHLEKPDKFVDILVEWLDGRGRGSGHRSGVRGWGGR
jgi:2-succinyl-6-hydroxy-2,4-cyclohexadiene-1-carboxylate synthase